MIHICAEFNWEWPYKVNQTIRDNISNKMKCYINVFSKFLKHIIDHNFIKCDFNQILGAHYILQVPAYTATGIIDSVMKNPITLTNALDKIGLLIS